MNYDDTKRIPVWSLRVGDEIAVRANQLPANAGQAPSAQYVAITAIIRDSEANLVHLNTATGAYHVVAYDRMVLAHRIAELAQ